MPYRSAEHRPDENEHLSPSVLYRVDASGAVGTNGAHGSSGLSGSSGSSGGGRGSDGRDATSAGSATVGQDAGTIVITLAPGEGDQVLLSGVVMRGGDARTFSDVIEIGEVGTIDLVALGGRGGHGGNGGSGGAGGRGGPGRDASRYSNGGDGGSGGNGGDAGAGSSGGAGGVGGDITVRVREEHTHLLMLLRHDVSGGDGGNKGKNGTPGSGGSGGAGGSSYSWTETDYYTDSEGNQQSTTTYHSNAGGVSGYSGSRGRVSSARPQAGAGGARGAFRILVETATDELSYPSVYRLRVRDFEHVSKNRDEIYEPGEKIIVDGVTVENVGGMPTPSHHDIHLSLESDGWIFPEKDCKLILPRALPAGEQVKVPGELIFEVGGFDPKQPGDALHQLDTIVHRAELPSVKREFEGYHREEDKGVFVVQYPLEASAIEGLYSLAPGESTWLKTVIRNDAADALGSASEARRRVRVRVSFFKPREGDVFNTMSTYDESESIADAVVDTAPDEASELGPAHVSFTGDGWSEVHDESGALIGVEREVPLFEARTTKELSVRVHLSDDAPAYHQARFLLSFEIGKLDDPETLRLVQLRDFPVRVATRYLRDPAANMLLVVNNKTRDEEIAAWREQAATLGYRVNLWDVAREGHLDLLEAGLLQDFRNGTIVLLNDRVDTPSGEEPASAFFDPGMLLPMRAHGVHLLVVGGDVDLGAWLLPPAPPGLLPHDSTNALTSAIFQRGEAGEPLQPRGHVDVAPVHVLTFSDLPDASGLAREAERVITRLAFEFPSRRFVGIAKEKIEQEREGVLKRFQIGTVEVCETLPTATGAVVHIDERARPRAGDAIRSAQTRLTLMLAQRFPAKIARLKTALERPDDDPTLLASAILSDLTVELFAILETRWRAGLSMKETRAQLPLLRTLVETTESFAPIDPESVAGRVLTDVAARVAWVADAMTSWWEWPIAFARRAPRLKLVVWKLLDEWMTNIFTVPSTEAHDWTEVSETRVEVARRQWRVTVKDLRAQLKGQKSGMRRVTVEDELLAVLRRDGITTDAEVLRSGPTRSFTGEVASTLRAQRKANGEARRDAQREMEVARERLG